MPALTPRALLEHLRARVAELERDLAESEDLLRTKRGELLESTEGLRDCRARLTELAGQRSTWRA